MHWLHRVFIRTTARVSIRTTTRASQQSTARSTRHFHRSVQMSSASTAMALYATVVSTSHATEAVPEDVKELRHHAKGGKGFINPWPSFLDRNVLAIGTSMIK